MVLDGKPNKKISVIPSTIGNCYVFTLIGIVTFRASIFVIFALVK